MRTAIVGAMVAVGLAFGTTGAEAAVPLVNVPCATAVATVVQGMGSPAAPILVPSTLPVRVCTVAPGVQIILPAFRVMGSRAARILVPEGLPTPVCTPATVVGQAIAPSPGTLVETSPGSGVFIVTGGGAPTSVLVPVVTCF